MDLVIFHYHFDPGGVTSVVSRAVRAFRTHLGKEIGSIRLVCGRDSGDLAAQLDCTCLTWPELDYLDPDAFSDEKAVAAARNAAGRLAKRLLEHFGGEDTLWWIHNHHLGKNPLFSQAILEIAAGSSAQRMLLQIHDFPERARFDNLRFLQRILTLPPYPLSPGVHYSVLNDRDRGLLLSAGVPAERVDVLENPLEPYRMVPGDRQAARGLLAASAASFSFRPDRPLLLYPIRAIRRKNVLEAALLTRLLGEDDNLAVTLPGTSKPERPYSGLVSRAYTNRSVRGLWEIGTLLPELGLGFDDLVAAADMVLSTSVQEGFGYLFVNTLQWGLPLAARDLETLAGLKELFEGYPACFYAGLVSPLDARRRGRLRALYSRKLEALSELMPPGRLKALKAEFSRLFAGETVDFSYLPPTLQAEILASLDSGRVLGRLREANARTIREIRDIRRAFVPDKSAEVEERFGYLSYARRFRRLCRSWPQPAGTAALTGEGKIQDAVLAACMQKENFRILYD
jgi:hypothetical protein